jgi:hypothetical protein
VLRQEAAIERVADTPLVGGFAHLANLRTPSSIWLMPLTPDEAQVRLRDFRGRPRRGPSASLCYGFRQRSSAQRSRR